MKSKDKKTLQELSIDKLKQHLLEVEKEMVNELMQQKIGKIKNVHAYYLKKKEIAIIKTFIRTKELIAKDQNGKSS